MQKTEHSITLIGAGPVGSLLAGFLARRGFRVDVYERRPDMRKHAIAAGRSINLALSARGLFALKQLGLEDEVMKQAVPMKGRMIHALDGKLTFQRYGKDDSECIHSVSRGELNKLLMTHAEATGKVHFHFEHRAIGADLEHGSVNFHNEATGKMQVLHTPCLIGTDGSASVLRKEIVEKSPDGDCSEEYLDYGYKELTIPAGRHAGFHGSLQGGFQIEKNALHIWPRGTFMLIALPNLDGSFTCTLFLPNEGALSFSNLKDPAQVKKLFSEHFSDVLPLIPDLEAMFLENPTGRMVTVKCSPWNYRGNALLLGDAAHAIVPFFGQGMNAGFEDCTVFDELFSGGNSLEEIFSLFTNSRKQDTDSIADMAVENFTEMRDKVGNPRFLMEKAVERILQEKFPADYISRYSLVTFRREPYRLALKAGRIQAEILSELCNQISAAEQVNLAQAEKQIKSRLSPLFTSEGTRNGS